jgi:competence protein ComEC
MPKILILLVLLQVPEPEVARAQASQETAALEVIFLAVGQGDGIIMRSPEGKVVLVDAGPGPDIVQLLRDHGVDTIDLAIATHPHADHIGGMAEVVRHMPVRFYMDNGVPHTTSTYLDLLQTLEESDVTYLAPIKRLVELGSLSLQVLPPPRDDALTLNNRSIGVLVEFGEFKAIFTGDAEIAELNHFLELGVPEVTLLKASHHGSRDAVSPGWLAATKPDVVVISCGVNNPYGHPHTWALRYYQAVASAVHRTDRDGEVAVRALRNGTYTVVTRETAAVTRARRESPPSREPLTRTEGALTLWVKADAPGNDHHNLNGEYAVIRNRGVTAMEVGGWILCDAAAHCFTFPTGASIAPADSAVVYTGGGTDDRHSFYMNRGQAVWNNRGDTATLRNREGRIVLRYVY